MRRGAQALAVLAGLSLAALPSAGALAHDGKLNEDGCHFGEDALWHCHMDTKDDGIDWGRVGIAVGSAALVFLIIEGALLAAAEIEVAPRDDGSVALDHHLGAGHHLGFESKNLPGEGHAKAFWRLRF